MCLSFTIAGFLYQRIVSYKCTEWRMHVYQVFNSLYGTGVPQVWRSVRPDLGETVTEWKQLFRTIPSGVLQLQQERIWARVLEKVFEGDGMGEEVPGYGAPLRLEEHCLSPEGVSARLVGGGVVFTPPPPPPKKKKRTTTCPQKHAVKCALLALPYASNTVLTVSHVSSVPILVLYSIL